MDGVDERPLAVRRKRRTSTGPVDHGHQSNEHPIAEVTACQHPKTPGDRKKRLRFSDPLIQTTADSSTGLTPALNRTKLMPEKSAKKASKRLSLPVQLTTTPTTFPASSQYSSSPAAIEIQFAPLRQAIDARTMRRLKRNNLSDEVNEIYAEKRNSKSSLQQQVDDLRKQLVVAKERSSRTAVASEDTFDNSIRIAELEGELVKLKQEMRERSVTVDPATLEVTIDAFSTTTPTALHLDDSSDGFQNFGHVTSSESLNRQRTTTASPPLVSVAEASTQASLPLPDFSEVFRSARITFEHLFPGEATIGLDNSEPEPLLGTMISRLQTLKADINKTENKISISETSKANMGRHLNNALLQLERHQANFKALSAELKEEKARASSAELEKSTYEARVENVQDKCTIMEKQRNEHALALERLRPAYEHYRKECETLTKTIMELESSHKTALEVLRSELSVSHDSAMAANQLAFEEVKSDLEAQVAAESTGRRKAEESAVERLTRIKQLENYQKELQEAINDKQSILRTLDDDLKQTRSDHENEVGQLNVRIGKLTSELSVVNSQLATARQEASRLSELLEQEKAAGTRAVEAMQSKMKQCAKEVNVVGCDYAEGVKEREGVAQSFGLMTPVVAGGRFRDAEADEKVEGHVEIMRGKKRTQRPDSGVEIWDMVNIMEEEEGDGDVSMEG
ncbi:MAG: hypothetical protein Q9201_005118 [Fulgogasparrea decipioides]